MFITEASPSADHRRRRTSSKRKLDDETDLISVAMEKIDAETKIARVVPWPAFGSELYFFARMMPKGNSVAMYGYAEETVSSLLSRIESITGVPASEQRLIYRGKQLRLEQRLNECGIERDSTVNVVGYLRSAGNPTVCRVMNDIVTLIGYVERGEMVQEATRFLNFLISKHFDLEDFLEAFVSFKAPAMFVALYLSSHAGKKDCGDSCIRHVLNCCRSSLCKPSQGHCITVVLEFCELLKPYVSRLDDSLYATCRSTVAFLLNANGVWYGPRNARRRVSLSDILEFFTETAERLLMSLDFAMRCPIAVGTALGDVFDFTAFLTPLKGRIREKLGLEIFVSDGKWSEEEDPFFGGHVDCLRVMFFRYLDKMDDCLRAMEEWLTTMEKGRKDVNYPGWSEYLNILKQLYLIAKVYDGAEEKFWRVLMDHRSMLSLLIVQFIKKTDDHWWILENKSVTDFEGRRHLVMLLLPDVKEDYMEFHEMLIDRSQLLSESFAYISQAKAASLRAGLFMEFKNEEASGPGVLREWFVLVCHAIFNPKNALFVACPDDYRRFYPNPASKVDSLHLRYFSFSGRILALALMKKVQVGIVFDRVFFTQLAGNYVTLEDIRDADPYLYRSCKQILEMDADFIDSDALGLTFVRETEELGKRNVIELCPGGKNIVVNSKNRVKFVDLLIQNRFVKSISAQVSHFAQGFADILTNSNVQKFFQSLDLEDLDWMLHGSENAISVEDWKAHTTYNGYKETDRQISWFWQIVDRMSAERRKVLLFFWTSVKYLPVEGFRGLASRLSISRSVEAKDSLPSSHTCFYQLCLPAYSSKAVMQNCLGVITQEHIGCSFGTS